MLNESSSNVWWDIDGLPWQLPCCCSSASLTGAVIDKSLYPLRMLSIDGSPKESSVCAQVACPLIWESFKYSWQLDSMRPDLSHRKFRPAWDDYVCWHLCLQLHDLLLLKKGMHKIQSAITWTGQEEQLQTK